MDIEKLIEGLNQYSQSLIAYKLGADFADACTDAATALSTLQAENEKLRETVDKYATAARVIALHLKPFCDESLPYDEMIADAARKASDELEQVKRALAMMWYAYDNKDGEFPHEYEIEAMQTAEEVLGPWAECMPKYLKRED